MVIFLE